MATMLNHKKAKTKKLAQQQAIQKVLIRQQTEHEMYEAIKRPRTEPDNSLAARLVRLVWPGSI